jgi:[ribosomal protein S5]-alanine N-acetyltransferase
MVRHSKSSHGSSGSSEDSMGTGGGMVRRPHGGQLAPANGGRGSGAVRLPGSRRSVLETFVRVLGTPRLSLRRLTPDDAEFIVELLNDAAFIRFVGDKGVRTPEDARQYILTGPIASYESNRFGLWLVELNKTSQAIGICGLLKRENLPEVDIGFAFLPAYRSRGYAFESASAVLGYARNELGLTRIVAITDSANTGSIRVLEKMGMKFERMISLSEGEAEIQLLASEV